MNASGETFDLYEYPLCPGVLTNAPDSLWSGGEDANGDADAVPAHAAASHAEAQTAQEIERAFERGRQEGARAEQAAQSAALAAEKQRLVQQPAEWLAQFTAERDEFFQAAEQEVVRLALAVAARILRREAQMDPLLLTAAVRVALGQLSHASGVRLLVPGEQLAMWRETIAHLPNLAVRPEVIADGAMQAGECRIETSVGSVDLGLRAQLKEIERGFFDGSGQDADAGRGQEDDRPQIRNAIVPHAKAAGSDG